METEKGAFSKFYTLELSFLTPYYPEWPFGPWYTEFNPTLSSVISLIKRPQSYPQHTSCSCLPALAVLPLFHPFSPRSSRCSNSIMDVHNAQFTSGAFSVTTLLNSFAVARLRGDGAGLSFCVHPAYILTPSGRHPTTVTNCTHLPPCAMQCTCKILRCTQVI